MRPPLAELLDLAPHPEGGWFRRIWTSPERVRTGDGRERAAASMIHFLLPAGESSAWHRVGSDEIWIAQRGVVVLELGGTGTTPVARERCRLDADPEAGGRLQVTVPEGTWQRTRPADHDALVVCVVCPEFHFDDFELLGPAEG